MRVQLDNILNEFEGQRSRSPCRKMWFWSFWSVDLCWFTLSWHMMACWVTASVGSFGSVYMLKGLSGKNTSKEGTTREGASTLRRFHYDYYQMWTHTQTDGQRLPSTLSPSFAVDNQGHRSNCLAVRAHTDGGTDVTNSIISMVEFMDP